VLRRWKDDETDAEEEEMDDDYDCWTSQ